MNVYEIEEYIIAAETTDAAFGVYVEETNQLDDVFIGELIEGESDDIVISIKRFTAAEIASKQVPCCGTFDDGCELCAGKDEPVFVSYQDLIDRREDSTFPCVIAKEE